MEEAKKMFDRFGIKKVSMNDIAEHFQMSKKTLYKHFPSKEEMVRKIISWKMQHIDRSVAEVVDDKTLEFAEKMKRIFKLINREMANYQIRFLNEIRIQYPDLYTETLQFRQNVINKRFRKVIHEGIDSGYVRKDVDSNILIDMYLAVLERIMSPEYILSTNYSNVEIYNMIVKVYFTGILTKTAQEEFILFPTEEEKNV